MKLFLRDSTFAHCAFSNNPLPPKTFSKNIEWVRTPGPLDQTIYTDLHVQECNGGTGWLIEPRDLIPHIYDYVLNNLSRFKEVWTHDKEFIEQLGSKGIFVPFGGCWIDQKDYGIHPKTKNFSIISSGKRQLPGHILRHQIIEASGNNIDVFGGGYKHINDKIEGLRDYRYQFVIENCKRDYWFTEKLLDCLMTGTIPIYWGCPSIHEFFSTDGFIIFNDLHELKEKLKLCTPEYYESRIDSIRHNFMAAQKYLLSEDWVYRERLHPVIDNTEHDKLVLNWIFVVRGDQTLRVEYPLNKDSIVLDIGGYKGDWAHQIYNKYQSSVTIFEPVRSFCENMKLNKPDNMHVVCAAASTVDSEGYIFINNDRSSVFDSNGDDSVVEKIQLIDLVSYIDKNKISKIDLIKINIEGGEYDLLEHIILHNKHFTMNNIQVQFHRLDDIDYINRYNNIAKQLEKTHELTYQYKYIWENWRIKTNDT